MQLDKGSPGTFIDVNGQTCSKICYFCAHAEKKAAPGQIGKWLAECRAFPPCLLSVLTSGGQTVMVQWPVVTDSPASWCGQWKERLTGT